jgi:hypothetical protein
MNYLQSQGWTAAQSAGILGNAFGESGFNSGAIGDGGAARGLFQWHPDRAANFTKVFGGSLASATPMQQLQFANWELHNTESAAGRALRGTSSAADAAATFMKAFERPANLSSLGKRIASAESLLKGGQGLADTAKGLVSGLIGDGAVAAANAIIPGSGMVLDALGFGGDSCGWLCQLKNWIADSGFFQRLALGVLAIVIFGAAFYLYKPSVVQNAVKAAA